MANADKNNQNASKALNQCLKELLIANEDENNEYDSGMLSPRRLEAIHIAFNEVFDTALKDGTVLDMSSYPPFEQVFEAAMRGESRVFSSEDNRSNLEPKSAEELHGVKKRNVSVRLDTGRSTNRRMGRNLSQKTSSASLFTNFKDNLASDSKRSANFAVEVSTAVKRPEHRQAEPERRFECGWPGCNKVYGFLNHLNSHIVRSKHGEKKHPNEFSVQQESKSSDHESAPGSSTSPSISMNSPKGNTNPSPKQRNERADGELCCAHV